MSTKNGFIYLAQPYSSPDEATILYRVEQAFKATAKLMDEGNLVFSPIVHTHELGKYINPDLAIKHEFWMEQDIAILRHAAELRILMLEGWQHSKGLAQEVLLAETCQIPITFMEAI